MLVSHAHKFILMSPWKTASSTCYESLRAYNNSKYSRFFEFNPYLNRVIHQHLTLAELLALPEGRMGYKLTSFVRNPYDRAYSGFLQIQRDFENQPKTHFDEPWIAALVREQVAENMSRVIRAGFNFDEWLRILPDHEIFAVGRNSNMVLHPVHYWTHINGEQRVDFVGKVEHFEADFRRLCRYIGIQTPAILSSNVTQDLSEHGFNFKYVERMSRRSLDRINALFVKDFEFFEYDQV